MPQSQVVLLAVDFFEMAVLEMGALASSALRQKGLTRRRGTQQNRKIHPNYFVPELDDGQIDGKCSNCE